MTGSASTPSAEKARNISRNLQVSSTEAAPWGGSHSARHNNPTRTPLSRYRGTCAGVCFHPVEAPISGVRARLWTQTTARKHREGGSCAQDGSPVFLGLENRLPRLMEE